MNSVQTNHSYFDLPQQLYSHCQPTPVQSPEWLAFNQPLALELGFAETFGHSNAALQILSGNQQAGWSQPLAQAYSGHQFGQLSPRLGDGRALLLAEIIDRAGQRRDLQLKGSGPTPYSRRGDGRSALGPVIREYLVSEAMHALGVPTSRALAAVISGEPVYRQEQLPGGILSRVAASHIRIGTFQYAAMLDDSTVIKTLADYVIERHYPACAASTQPYLALLQHVIQAQASLVAHWMSLGFVHGVMNTDNMLISGETIDYGPCAFLDIYQPNTVFSSIDQQGRYAYRNQAPIAQWNLARLAESLLPLLAETEADAIALATAALNTFPDWYQQAWQQRFCAKLGLANSPQGAQLAEQLLALMAAHQVDFTLCFRKLAFALADSNAAEGPASLFGHTASAPSQGWQVFAAQWQQQLQGDVGAVQQAMLAVNPYFIPRNHRIEQIIQQVVVQNDRTLFQRFASDLTQPFRQTEQNSFWAEPPAPNPVPYRTFCGT